MLLDCMMNILYYYQYKISQAMKASDWCTIYHVTLIRHYRLPSNCSTQTRKPKHRLWMN